MFVFIQKQKQQKKNSENFAFLIDRVLKLFTREICIFLKRQPTFSLILLFLCIFANKHFT